ncbi:MAG: NADH-quinone oxidoreductase subunit NuoK [Opitutaceae bacterium]|jgi:NADH-quinone oxidoreductase subunit K|nr:NADH-quinone oxidoreductase subunit NuoK [Opitutaceae bacterium]
MNLDPLHLCLLLSAALFCAGLAGVLSRSGAIFALLGIELMLNAANLNFAAFWRHGQAAAPDPILFVLFSIAVAAAEAAVGLALVIAFYRHRRTSRLPAASRLKG